MSDRHIIVVDGIDGSGKSHLARRLVAGCERRGEPAVLLRVDDFRRPLDWAGVDDEGAAYWERYYDFAALTAAVDAYLAGAAELDLAVFDPVAERITEHRTLALRGVDLLVLEGVFPLRVPAAAAGTLIYLDTAADEARRRIIARDMPKGRSRAEVERRIDRRYAPCQRRYHQEFRPRERAHLIIANDDLTAPRLVAARVDDRPAPVRRALADVIPVPGRS